MYMFKNDQEIEHYAMEHNIDLFEHKIEGGHNTIEAILLFGEDIDPEAKRDVILYCLDNHKSMFETNSLMIPELYKNEIIDEEIFKRIIMTMDDTYGNDWGYYKVSYEVMKHAPVSFLEQLIDKLDRDFIETQLFIGACTHGRVDTVKYLIEEKDVDPNSSDGFAAMAILKHYGPTELRYLIEKGLRIESRQHAILHRIEKYKESEKEDYEWVYQHISENQMTPYSTMAMAL